MKKRRHCGIIGKREHQPRTPKFCNTCERDFVPVNGKCPQCKGRM